MPCRVLADSAALWGLLGQTKAKRPGSDSGGFSPAPGPGGSAQSERT